MTGQRDRARRLHPPPQIYLAAQARDTLAAAGRRSQCQEHGGILVGYREDLSVIVEDALAVEDSTAGHSWYVRRSRRANDVLATYLERLAQTGEGHDLGYVGEWHTHPLPMLPSPTDHAAMRTMARKSRHPVAMVVVARRTGATVTFHGLVSTPRTARHRLAGQHLPTTVLTD